ncbi:MAG: hypothetical protein CL903_04205 [Dehalococcoidia bacterium]|nr:hypothetical protein [Dehalococcoidia bacterium]
MRLKIFKYKHILVYIFILLLTSCSNGLIGSTNATEQPIESNFSEVIISEQASESRYIPTQSSQSNSLVQTGINVQANSSISVPADLASFNIKVKSRKKTVTEARENTAIYVKKVVAAIKKINISEDDIQTTSFNIYPETRWIEKKDDFGVYSESTTIAYSVENSINVTVRNLDNLGKVIDEVTIAGEDQIQINSINFSVSNINSYEKKLRETAAITAKNKAQTYVESLGLKLGNLSYISEISSPVTTPNYAPRMEMAMSADAQYTPSTFIPGNIEISISIQANFEISR